MTKIVRVSTWEVIRLHFFTFVYGLAMITKRFIKWAWNPKTFFNLRQRDKPPACLVEDTLGKHSFIKLKGVKFHYVTAGNPDSPLVLLLHGFPDCWLSWREQLPVLSEHFRVVALDLKGFGDSEKPTNKSSYRIEILVEELKEFVHALGAKSCIVIGHDLGGILAWYLTAMYEDLVCKLVCISSPHPNLFWNETNRNGIFDNKWFHFSRLPFLPEIDVMKEDLSAISDTFNHLRNNSNTKNKSYLEAYKYMFSRKEDWTGPINYYRNLPYNRLNIAPQNAINVKTLLIVGNMDRNVSLETMVKSSEFVEKSRVKIINGAKHFPHQEAPVVVNEIIRNFLIDTPSQEKSPTKSIMSSWLGSITSTVKYGNQVIDAVHKKTNGVVNGLPSKVLHFGQSYN